MIPHTVRSSCVCWLPPDDARAFPRFAYAFGRLKSTSPGVCAPERASTNYNHVEVSAFTTDRYVCAVLRFLQGIAEKATHVVERECCVFGLKEGAGHDFLLMLPT